jgi:hypothetical protein
LKKTFLIFFVLIISLNTVIAQSGGKKRERKSKKSGASVLKQYKSHGHADEFARGGIRKGRLSRLFSKPKPSWTNTKSGSKRNTYRANRYLFFRHRSEGVMNNEMILNKQNKTRRKNRVIGSKSFKHKRHYKSRSKGSGSANIF